MREIKFRAWIKKESRMTEVGVLSQNGKSITVDDSDMDGTYNRHVGGNKFELMQFTGLKDKNGKEIYEGDIVNHIYHHQKAVIEWINCGLMMKYSDGLKDSMFAIDMEHIEIIGNIYENPELLNRHC